MMRYTDRHFRRLIRLATRYTLLYTEMTTCSALLHGPRARLLAHGPEERPLALQLAGNRPDALSECAAMAEQAGFDEINLNVGCPSQRAGKGRFGACLMAEPARVAACVATMRASVSIPITVKTRIGIDNRDGFGELADFVERVGEAGCRTFIVHARKAWLDGVNPRQNRTRPPLRYDRVYRLKRRFPQLEIVINGGIGDLEAARRQLTHVDGAMIGRAAYRDPYLLADADRYIFGTSGPRRDRLEILRAYCEYVRAELTAGTALALPARHLASLFRGQPGSHALRRCLGEAAGRRGAGLDALRLAETKLLKAARGMGQAA